MPFSAILRRPPCQWSSTAGNFCRTVRRERCRAAAQFTPALFHLVSFAPCPMVCPMDHMRIKLTDARKKAVYNPGVQDARA